MTPSSTPGSFFGAGTPLAFNYLVTNSGNVTLHGIGVTELAHRPVGDLVPEPDARAGRDRDLHGELHDERRPT